MTVTEKCLSLQKTDITQPALEALTKSQIRRVLIVGRRGPAQIACTIKVLRQKRKFVRGKSDIENVFQP